LLEDGFQVRTTGMSGRVAAWLAWSASGLTLVMIVCAVALSLLNRRGRGFVLPRHPISCVAVGGLVASYRPETR
jgi:hypothetical protein